MNSLFDASLNKTLFCAIPLGLRSSSFALTGRIEDAVLMRIHPSGQSRTARVTSRRDTKGLAKEHTLAGKSHQVRILKRETVGLHVAPRIMRMEINNIHTNSMRLPSHDGL